MVADDGSRYTFYRKVAPRRSNALSKLSLYVEANIVAGRIAAVRLAVGAVAPTVVRVPEAEELFAGCSTDEVRERAEEAVRLYSQFIHPIDDQRSTRAYRRETAVRLIRHVLSVALPLAMENK